MAFIELKKAKKKERTPTDYKQEGLGSEVLLYNARWFTTVRWIVAALFGIGALFGIFLSQFLKKNNIILPVNALWLLSLCLFAANIIFSRIVFKLTVNTPVRTVSASIWTQIIFDLIIVTIMVHKMGTITTFFSFTYLFHIALACVFFPPGKSIIVPVLAAFFFVSCLILEFTNILPLESVIQNNNLPIERNISEYIIHGGSAIAIWFIVWYFVATLSRIIQRNQQMLISANKQMKNADKEKTKLLLTTTHELKSPFSSIESNIQLLRYQFWKKIPKKMKEIIQRIEAKSSLLRERIKDILILGEIRSDNTKLNEVNMPFKLNELINNILDDMEGKTSEKKIKIKVKIPELNLRLNKKHLAILFTNLISNAIKYSHDADTIQISSLKSKQGNRSISITDHGIGIREDALPYIFDEYFRSKEASKFNKLSTGLGLAIVKEIAFSNNLVINVYSEQDKGTKFEIIFPKKIMEAKNG